MNCKMTNYAFNILCASFIFLLVVMSSADMTHLVNAQVTDSRIVGGKVVNIIQYPHQVSLRERNASIPEDPYDHSCGGSIYSDRIVITASHCVDDMESNELMVVVGTNQRAGGDGVIVPVKEILMHEEYDEELVDNDIALLVLAAALPINNFTIKAIELTEVQPRAGDIATITGWGLDAEGQIPDFLHEVQVPIVSNEICDERYAGSITDAMLCAGLLDVGGKDACQMDSGGPLLVNGKLAGVVSWGIGCGQANFPGVYANVWYLLPWLRATIAEVEAALLNEVY